MDAASGGAIFAAAAHRSNGEIECALQDLMSFMALAATFKPGPIACFTQVNQAFKK
jgi:hypothetical protein